MDGEYRCRGNINILCCIPSNIVPDWINISSSGNISLTIESVFNPYSPIHIIFDLIDNDK